MFTNTNADSNEKLPLLQQCCLNTKVDNKLQWLSEQTHRQTIHHWPIAVTNSKCKLVSVNAKFSVQKKKNQKKLKHNNGMRRNGRKQNLQMQHELFLE